ncbi:phenylalanine--tRNA ligase subunit beta [Candidatus Desantisbacteria bacterium]|nr:phenylalanine--tRNA ligase subunit beta [Candidatus Desantisbacteria bacterium]
MKLSYEWLKEFVDIDISPQELSDRITMAGLEVAGIERVDEDYILDVELTVNRGDCLSMLGMAREVSAIMGINGKQPDIPQLKEKIPCRLEISLQNPELCPRYTARVIQNIRVEPSPLWLQEKLKRFGIRPINNIVDVTNFCSAELGQPMHAFDYDLINGNSVIIRQAIMGEKIRALDEREYELIPTTLVIADQMKPIALAGVIGGADTGVTDMTTTILMECAYFSASSIRRTARLLGIQTESSYRFERGVDPQGLINAQNRAAGLILSMCPEAKISNIIDCYPTTIPCVNISLRIERVNRILGTKITPEEMRNILIRLGFEVEPIVFQPYSLKVKAPSFRFDMNREIDLVEEIFRIYGCEKIPVALPPLSSIAFKKKAQIVNERAKNILCGCGLNEVITYSFLDPEMLEKMSVHVEAQKKKNHVVVSNPLSEEGRLLTHSLIPNLISIAAWNVNREATEMIWEAGDTIRWDGEKQKRAGFYNLSGILHTLFTELGICEYVLEETKDEKFLPGVCARIRVGDEILGLLGQVNPDITERLKLPQNIYAMEIVWQKVIAIVNLARKFTPLPRYPSVTRDMAILAKDDMASSKLIEVIRNAGGPLIESVRLFDLYRGEHVSTGYKSLAYSITYRSHEKTLTEDEVNRVHDAIIQQLGERLGVRMR